jgi:hypothetical protein
MILRSVDTRTVIADYAVTVLAQSYGYVTHLDVAKFWRYALNQRLPRARAPDQSRCDKHKSYKQDLKIGATAADSTHFVAHSAATRGGCQ